VSCCDAPAWASQFDKRRALRDLRDYRRHGPAATTRALIDALRRGGVEHSTLLDIGGGVGAIQFELLAAGARDATSVDASLDYLAAAREEAARRGVTSLIRFEQGDFVDLAPQIPAADVVTLDRVVCCYAQMEPLVRLSAERCRRLFGLVYPRDLWLERAVVRVQNVIRRLWGNPFRSYVHSVAAMDALIRSLGFELRQKMRTFVWEVAVYQKGGVLGA
jgi:SAM-dependent methyltransferase